MTLDISRTAVTMTLAVAATVIIGLGVAGTLARYLMRIDLPWELRVVFDADAERNVPAWFSTLLLAGCALMCGLIARQVRMRRRPWVWHWRVLACGFLFMSLDEMAGLHEMLVKPTRNLLHTGGVFYFAWVIPAGAVVLLVGLCYLRFIFKLPRPTVLCALIIGGAVYLGGVIGVEMLGGMFYDPEARPQSLTYLLLVSLEEYCEMMGLIVFIFACFRYVEYFEQPDQDAAPASSQVNSPASSRSGDALSARPAR